MHENELKTVIYFWVTLEVKCVPSWETYLISYSLSNSNNKNNIDG